jgi:hypothetical protein
MGLHAEAPHTGVPNSALARPKYLRAGGRGVCGRGRRVCTCAAGAGGVTGHAVCKTRQYTCTRRYTQPTVTIRLKVFHAHRPPCQSATPIRQPPHPGTALQCLPRHPTLASRSDAPASACKRRRRSRNCARGLSGRVRRCRGCRSAAGRLGQGRLRFFQFRGVVFITVGPHTAQVLSLTHTLVSADKLHSSTKALSLSLMQDLQHFGVSIPARVRQLQVSIS